MKKIVSFGDSFVFGSELRNNQDGLLAWPGLAAADLGFKYETRSIPGCGNDAIARQIIEYFYCHGSENTLAVINWTWALRWDFYAVQDESWTTLGPTCVPSKLESHVGLAEAERIINFYQDYTGRSIVWDKWRSLSAIYAAQQYLEQLGVPAVETYIDPHLVMDTEHNPGYIAAVQQYVIPRLRTFQGMNFLDWSRANGFKVTDPGWHPLEEAHRAAADLWKDTYAQAFTR